MRFKYWIKQKKGWQETDRVTYEIFNGEKCVLPSFQSPMWTCIAENLLKYR